LDGITSGDAHSGVWTIQLNFPQYTRSGHWTLFLVAFDALQNMTWMDASALSAAGFNAGIDVVSNPDLQPPQFVTASVTPTAIDVHDQDQTITVTAHVTDDLSGLGSVGGGSYAVGTMLRGPTSSIQRGATQRLSGTALDGMYQEPITIPRLSPTGLWSLGLEASDNVNNSTGWIEGTKVVSLGLPQYLLIYNVPFPPALVSVDPADGSATITWSPPTDDQGAPVTQYVITVSPGGVKVDTSGAVTATVIGGLTNGVRYSFSAQAVNKAGASTASPVLTAVPSAQPVSQPGGATLSSSGYWMLGSDGTVHTFGRAPFLGDAPVTAPAVRLTPTPSRRGYWIVDAGGHVYAFGDAPYLGGASGLSKGEVVTSLSATPSTQGYWLFTNRGRVLPFGDAAFLGDMSGNHLNGVALDSVPTPSGNGYYMVAADGGVFCFGDAHFNGSMGSTKLNAPVESLVPDPDGSGYWLVASDGGIFAFDAPFYGSMGGHPLNKPVTGMVGSSAGGGYLMVAADGGVFTFGKIAFQGSLGNAPPAVPIVAAATF
jgi:hypothetical protein